VPHHGRAGALDCEDLGAAPGWGQVILTGPEGGSVSSIPPRCRPLRAELDGIEAELRRLEAELGRASPEQRPEIEAQIRVLVAQAEDVAEELARCMRAAASHLFLVGAEYTQSTQYFTFHDGGAQEGPTNGVPLIARKELFVRAYVALRDNGNPKPSQVTGRLTVSRPDGHTFPEIAPEHDPVVARVIGDLERRHADHTLTFRVPAGHCAGRRRFRLEVSDPGGGFAFSETLEPVRFRELPQLRIQGVLVHYTGQGLDLPAPTGGDLVDSLDYAAHAFPISGIDYTGCTEIEFDGDLSSGGRGCGTGWRALLDRLTAMRKASGEYTLYVAVIPSATPTNKADGCGRTGVCAARVGNGQLLAHEIGHALGRRHAPCGKGVRNVDDNYPDYWGYRDGSIGEYGIRADTLDVFDPEHVCDVMGYRYPGWVSPYTYQKVGAKIAAIMAADETSVEIRRQPGEYLILNLDVRGDDTLRLLPSYRVTGPPPPMDAAEGSRFIVELLDADGDVLESAPAEPADPFHSQDEEHPGLTTDLHWHASATAVSVRRDGRLLGTLDLEPVASSVRLREQPRTSQSHPALMHIDWEADPVAADQPTPRFLIRYSCDDGASWRALAADLTSTTYDVDTRLLPGGDRCRFEVIASGGGQSASARSEPFGVPRKPRRAFLLAPRDGTTVAAGRPLLLRGGAFSPDAGTVAFDEVMWTSSRDGFLGTGYELSPRLSSVGHHEISLEFTDGLGGRGSAVVAVEVTST
jgi:hypothetical protein